MNFNVDDAGGVEARGVLGRVGDRFPLASPFGTVAAGGTGLVDGSWTPFGMTLRVLPSNPVMVDLTGIGYDQSRQLTTGPLRAAPATQPGTKGVTANNTDGANGPDTIPDEVDDIGWD